LYVVFDGDLNVNFDPPVGRPRNAFVVGGVKVQVQVVVKDHVQTLTLRRRQHARRRQHVAPTSTRAPTSTGRIDVGQLHAGEAFPQQPLGAADITRMLSFQRLRVYQRAIEFLALSTEIVQALPQGHAERADQLTRSAESVVRNIAEGAGRWSRNDAARHYKIARGEAMECASSLDIMKLHGLIAPGIYQNGTDMLEGVVAMLTKMV
jgi:four helix bundle protein